MPEMSYKIIQPDITFEQLCEEFAKLQKNHKWLLNGSLDFENIVARGIKAENIEAKTITANEIAAETITANELAANSITTEKIQAGAVTADKITVSELSAINANMGTITAGSITTNAQIDVGTDVTIGDNLYMNETSATSKGIIFNNQGGGNSARISVLSGDMGFNTDGHITMNIGSSQGLVVNQKVTADGFEALSGVVQAQYINATGTLSAGNGASGTFYVSSSLGGAIDTTVTVTNGIITSIA